jgi:hypothetical protein
MTERKALPSRRANETFEITHNQQRVTITLGFYPNHGIGEVFISAAKAGSELEATARDGAILVSMMLQHGITLAGVASALTRDQDGRPSSIIGAVIDSLA